MAKFEVKVVPIESVREHPNADRLEIVMADGSQVCAQKGLWSEGDLGILIPEASLLPEALLKDLGLTGKLSGPGKNRVKPVRLRGELSEGILMPAPEGAAEGDQMAEELGIEKYTPPIPVELSGEVWAAGHDKTLNFDIENYQKHKGLLQDGDYVMMTEKIHGTFTLFGFIDGSEGDVLVSSKGLSAKGLALKENETNLYWRAFRKYESGLRWMAEKVCSVHRASDGAHPIWILGETFGRGIQDLSYGQEGIGFRVFDINFDGKYLRPTDVHTICWKTRSLDVTTVDYVPVLYNGPFSEEILEEYTNGKSAVGGDHIREGVVIRSIARRHGPSNGRLALKSVSEDYKTRKGGTEGT